MEIFRKKIVMREKGIASTFIPLAKKITIRRNNGEFASRESILYSNLSTSRNYVLYAKGKENGRKRNIGCK